MNGLNARLIHSSRRNPCPVCNRSKDGDCRISHDENLVLCHTYSDGGEFPGWKFIGQAENQTWGKFIKIDGTARPVTAKRIEPQEQRETLPPSVRDREYRRIVNNFGDLGTLYRKELNRRGLTSAEIDFAESSGLIANWLSDENIAGNPNLAGISPATGHTLGTDGLAIAAMNLSGEICGYQISPKTIITARLKGHKTEGSKYIWLSSSRANGGTPHLANGELPLAVFKHPETSLSDVKVRVYSEGLLKGLTTALKYWANGRTDIMVISTPGCQFGIHRRQIEEIKNATPNAVTWLSPDAGSVDNINVLKGYLSLAEIEPQLQVMWWGQFKKNNGFSGCNKDIDEIPRELLNHQNFIDYQRWDSSEIMLACKRRGLMSDGEKKALVSKVRIRHTYTPDTTIDNEFLPTDIIDKNLWDDTKLIALKSAMGTGKTELIKYICQRADTRVFVLNHRNKLGIQTAGRIPDLYHLHHDLDGRTKYLWFDNPKARLAFCIDSLINIDDSYFVDSIVIIDEIIAVWNHLLLSETLKDKRERVFKKITRILTLARKVYLFDANLTDRMVETIKELGKFADFNTTKIENKFKPVPYKVEVLLGSKGDEGIKGDDDSNSIKENDYSSLIDEILTPGGKKLVILDSLKLARELHELATEKGIKAVEISSETTNIVTDDDRHKLAIAALGIVGKEEWNRFLEENQIDLLIVTPSAESGLSIDAHNYFNCVYGLFYGVIGIDSVLQMIGRLRDRNTLRKIWLATASMAIEKKYRGSQLPSDIIQADIDEFCDTADIVNSDSDLLQISQDYKHNELAKYRAEILANAIQDKRILRELFLAKVSNDEGFIVRTYTVDREAKEVTQELKEAREAIDLETATNIYQSINIDDKTAQKIDSKEEKTDLENYQLKRYKLTKALPEWEHQNSFTPVAIKNVFDSNLIGTSNRYWGIHNQQEYLAIRKSDFDQQIGIIEGRGNNPFLPDLDYAEIEEVEAAIDAGILDIIGQSQPLTKDSPDVIAACQRIDDRYSRQFGKLGKMEPIQYLRNVLRKFGYSLTGKRVRRGKDRIHEYYITEIDIPCWGDLKTATAIKFEEKLKLIERDRQLGELRTDAEAETVTEQGLEFVPTDQINSIEKTGLDGQLGQTQTGGMSPVKYERESGDGDHATAIAMAEVDNTSAASPSLIDQLTDICCLSLSAAIEAIASMLGNYEWEYIYQVSLEIPPQSFQGRFIRDLLNRLAPQPT
jgi:hypothetical protein